MAREPNNGNFCSVLPLLTEIYWTVSLALCTCIELNVSCEQISIEASYKIFWSISLTSGRPNGVAEIH